jgi:FAD:protein FMN transferase
MAKKSLWGMIWFLSTFPLLAQNPPDTVAQRYTQVLKLMGSKFEITAVSPDQSKALMAINACVQEIQRIEALISEWDSTSQTASINRWAGIQPVQVSAELFGLIDRSLKVSQLTQGAFDISYAAMDKIWKFDGSMTQMPTEEAIKASVGKIGYQKIILNKDSLSVFLKEKGMKIGFGAIGKGYAANRGQIIMQKLGIQSGMVNAGGDLKAWGKEPLGEDWKIGIADPNDKLKPIAWLGVSNTSVVTSGNYEKFVTFNGQKYTHIIDPRTGMPAFGLKSVTIVCPDAELADALATAVFVMGKEAGISLINQLKNVEGLIITEDNQWIKSEGLHLKFY